MAKQEVKQTQTVEREYIIPLRKEWMKVPRYKRTAKSVKAIKEFIAKHMRVSERNTDKVKLDVYLNNELWFRGGKKPFTKIKVKAIKEGDLVKVELVEVPEAIRFLKARQEKRHKKVEKKVEERPKEKPEEKLEEKVEEERTEEKKKEEEKEKAEEKKEEKEKVKSVEAAQEKIAERAAKAQKHAIKEKSPKVQRKALKK